MNPYAYAMTDEGDLVSIHGIPEDIRGESGFEVAQPDTLWLTHDAAVNLRDSLEIVLTAWPQREETAIA